MHDKNRVNTKTFRLYFKLLKHIPKSVWKVIWVIRRSFQYAKCNLTSWEPLEEQPPKWLYVNSIDICNANCIFCGYRFHKPIGVMSMKVCEKALGSYAEMNGENVSFAPIVGEPLLDPFLYERLKLARSLHFKRIQLFTNGILLKKHAEKLLLSGLTELHISLAGFNKEMYNRIYKVDAYNKVIEGIKELLKLERRLKTNVQIYIRLRPDDYDPSVMLGHDFWEHIYPLMDDNVYIDIATFFDNWGGLVKYLSGNMLWRVTSPFRSRPCVETFSLAILPDGAVRVCGCRFGREGIKDSLVIGNINDKSLMELWNSKKIKEIRRMFTRSTLPQVCRDCLAYTPV